MVNKFFNGGTGMEKLKEINIQSQYFTIIEMAEGVYAVIEKEKTTGSNAGIIDLGDHTVIFDTFLNIDAARELKQISEKLTGKIASFVINSHSHTDHIIGNSLYSDNAVIVSSELTREEIEKAKEEFQIEKAQYPVRIKEIENVINTKEDKTEIADFNNELLFLRNLVKDDVVIEVPNLTFKREITLHGSKRSLYLTAYDAAHSKGDVIAYLPNDKVCFAGDLLFAESHPWLGSGNPEKLKSILEELHNYNIEYFVPGHGRLSTKNEVLLQIQYINEVLQLVQRKNSLDEKDYSLNDISPVFRQWNSLCFSWNIKFLLERIKNEKK